MLDVLLSVTASIFVVISTYLFCRLLTDLRTKAIVSFSTILIVVCCIIGSNFNWKYTRTFDIVFIVAYVIILSSMVLVFGMI